MLTTQQINDFEQQGYLVLEQALTPKTLDAVIAEYTELLQSLCQSWVDQGLIDRSILSQSFVDQIKIITTSDLDYFQPMDISLPLGQCQPDTPIHLGNAVFDMMKDPQLLAAVESLIGSEITSNPIQHVRIKPPLKMVDGEENRAHIVRTDWHQDRAVALEQADQTRMVTTWIAITDATPENGCLQVIPGSHRKSMLPHCPASQLGIPESLLDLTQATPLPVKAGGAIIFHPLTVHCSLDNTSDHVRWSFDLRYNVTGDPTGRPKFPDFVVKSKADPSTELNSADEWARLWVKTRRKLCQPQAPTAFHRWDGSHEVCA